jgi:hypothetical protein
MITISRTEQAAVEAFVRTALMTIGDQEQCEPASIVIGFLALAAELALKDGTDNAHRMPDYARAFADVAATFRQACGRPRRPVEQTH